MKQKIVQAGKYFSMTARLMVGVSDYGNYVAIHQSKHSDQPVMSYEEFFKNRQEARYGNGNGFKCC